MHATNATGDSDHDDRQDGLESLVEKGSDEVLLKEMIGFVANRMIELDVEGLTGAGYGERSASRLKWRCRDLQERGVASVYGD